MEGELSWNETSAVPQRRPDQSDTFNVATCSKVARASPTRSSARSSSGLRQGVGREKHRPTRAEMTVLMTVCRCRS